MSKSIQDWFLIRADANETIGIGHVMRCLALAEWAYDRDLTAVLVTKFQHTFLQRKLENLGGKVIILTQSQEACSSIYSHSLWLRGDELEDADQTILATKKFNFNHLRFVVVDHYALGAPWERKLRNIAPVLAIDDLHDREHCCDYLLDQTLGRSIKEYHPLCSSNTKFLLGPNYALLRKEFAATRRKPNRRSEANPKILISLGGTDQGNISHSICQHILQSESLKNVSITIVTSSLNPNLKSLKFLTQEYLDLTLVVDSKSMSELMASHDICIGAAGSTAWERCALALPTLMIVLADNQNEIAINLANSGAAINLGSSNSLNLQMISETLNSVIENEELYQLLSESAYKICDGAGCKRTLDELIR